MSGYTHCRCRDCMETTISDDQDNPEYCSECIEAGCPDYRGAGTHEECQRPDAYGAPDCPTCDKNDEMYFDGEWKCGRCKWDEVFQGSQPGWTRVKIYPNGSALVHTGTSFAPWPPDAVQRAEGAAKRCCESRGVFFPMGSIQCPCLACSVWFAYLKEERAIKIKVPLPADHIEITDIKIVDPE